MRDGKTLPERARPARDINGEMPLREHRGWQTPRGLPHFDSPDVPQAVTFRLRDSLPRVVARGPHRRRDQSLPQAHRNRPRFRPGRMLAAASGDRRIVQSALQRADGAAYDLHAFVVMPNHIHALLTQRQGSRLADIVQAWKGYSAKEMNKVLGRTGTVWRRDYFDRFMRDETDFARTRAISRTSPSPPVLRPTRPVGPIRAPQDAHVPSATARHDDDQTRSER